MKNLIEVRTGEKPSYFDGKCSEKYSKIMKSLEALRGTTKCVIMEKGEFTQNKLTTLRQMCKRNDLGKVAMGKRDGNWYLWLEEA